ncbi:MAG: hypothetical protein WC483_02870 [Candidatus Paceibacterota bacterium]|nr:hypothetical protein [Candidatus Paceibacterota bacterium]
MKRRFKISSCGHEPLIITIETNDKQLVAIINHSVGSWLITFAKKLLPQSFDGVDEIDPNDLTITPDDQPTVKDDKGSLDSFPAFGDEITDSSAS